MVSDMSVAVSDLLSESAMSNQYVSISPFPFATTVSLRFFSQACLPWEISRSAVSREIWILPFAPVDSMRAATLTVSPNLR
jgi:hypothetical protein